MPSAKCTICSEELEDIDAICCGNDSCIHLMESQALDNCVTEFPTLYGDEVVLFHLETAFLALNSSRAETIYEPVPYLAFNEEDMSKRFKMTAITKEKTKKDLSKLKDLLTKQSPSILLTKIKSVTSDKELAKKIGDDLYSWIKFTLKTPTCLLKSECIRDASRAKILDIIEVREQNWTTSRDMTLIRFHGSASDSWYSILRNGLQILSKTSLQSHGAAFGAGIYTSNDLNVSRGYGDWIAICYVDTRFVAKSSSHTIVNDTRGICIKAIFKVRDLKHHYLSELTNILNIRYQLPDEQIISKTDIKGPRNKRIFRDYTRLQRECPHIKIEVDEDTFLEFWRISEVDEDKLKRIGGKIYFEIHFLSDYPFKPPFVRMISPRLEPDTGHITRGGAICMHELTTDGWQSSNTVYTIVQAIKELINAGGGSLSQYQKPYVLQEAQESFERLKKQHNWR